MADKRKCKYYKTCGNNLNCQRCTGYEKEGKKKIIIKEAEHGNSKKGL